MTSSNGSSKHRFPSPFEIETPPAAEGWEALYPYNHLFSDDRRDYEESGFWFQDSMHWREVLFPFDSITMEYALTALGQYNTRFYVIPPALGVDYRIINGYTYISPVALTDGPTIEARVPEFMQRAGHYFQNWNGLYDQWKEKMLTLIKETEAIEFSSLPERVPFEWIEQGRGVSNTHDMHTAYSRLIELGFKVWHYHFEFLNLGYAAYLDFFMFCKEAFPDIPEQSIAKMVAGIEVDLFRPDQELKRLAQVAVDQGVAEQVKSMESFDALTAELQNSEGGQIWLKEFDISKDPWFNFSSGTGMYHHDPVWMDNLDIPLGHIRNYINELEAGKDLSRPIDEIRAERDRIAEEYADLLADDDDREAFMGKLGLARTVFPYIENHNFYVEHWFMSVFWRKVRELGQVFADAGFWPEADDIFFLRRDEIPTVIFDLATGWSIGTPDRGSKYWPREIKRRKALYDALSAWTPPPALGNPPEIVTEPFSIMLWGITRDSIDTWLSGGADGALSGFAGSPGTVEGPARVVTSSAEIDSVLPGEVLVCPITAPSWAPAFSRIAAAVTDIGGMMSHAAIVCREYGLPAVVGTGFGTQTIQTGQRVRVNGTTGKVTILE